jgi:hypothetical protein
MFRLYALYNTQPGWWNDKTPGSLTLVAFLGLMILYDASSAANDPVAEALITEAAGRQVWMDTTLWNEKQGAIGRKPYFCKGDICSNGIFNFLAARVQSASDRLGYTEIPIDEQVRMTDEEGKSFMARASNIGYQIMYPPIEWKMFDENAPYHWGNEGNGKHDWWKSEFKDAYNKIEDYQKRSGSPSDLVWYKFGRWDEDPTSLSTFAILSLSQHANLGILASDN